MTLKPSAPLMPPKKTEDPQTLDDRRKIEKSCLKGGRRVLQAPKRSPGIILCREDGPDDRPHTDAHEKLRAQPLLDKGPEHTDVGSATCRPPAEDQREAWRLTVGQGRRNHLTDSSIQAR